MKSRNKISTRSWDLVQHWGQIWNFIILYLHKGFHICQENFHILVKNKCTVHYNRAYSPPQNEATRTTINIISMATILHKLTKSSWPTDACTCSDHSLWVSSRWNYDLNSVAHTHHTLCYTSKVSTNMSITTKPYSLCLPKGDPSGPNGTCQQMSANVRNVADTCSMQASQWNMEDKHIQVP